MFFALGKSPDQYINWKGETAKDAPFVFFPYERVKKEIKYQVKKIPELTFKPGGKTTFAKIFEVMTPRNEWSFLLTISWAISSIYSGILRNMHYGGYFPR